MSAFTERLDAAPTHVAYFTRGGGRALITQTIGGVLATDGDGIAVASAASNPSKVIYINTADIIMRKDNHERITDAEWDEIFATRGSEQVMS